MLYYDRIDISKGTDLTKSNSSKECMIAAIGFSHGFKFQDFVYDRCHDLTMLCLNISDITIITVDYRCIIYNICKSVAIDLLKNTVIEDRGYI